MKRFQSFGFNRQPAPLHIEQGDTVVSHFAYNNNNGNGVTHGAAVHRLENAKIVETRMYSSEPDVRSAGLFLLAAG